MLFKDAEIYLFLSSSCDPLWLLLIFFFDMIKFILLIFSLFHDFLNYVIILIIFKTVLYYQLNSVIYLEFDFLDDNMQGNLIYMV